jgi:predicted ATPase
MGRPIKNITLKGFKSIESLDKFPIKKLNVLIGANGAGKTNFVDFFRMLRTFADECFQQFVNDAGGGDGFLFLGPKVTSEISARLEFGPNAYEFRLKPTAQGTLQIAQESVEYNGNPKPLGSASLESLLKKRKDEKSNW